MRLAAMRLNESITPKATQKHRNALAPWLIMGSVWPVIGPMSAFTNMCRKACPLISRQSPATLSLA